MSIHLFPWPAVDCCTKLQSLGRYCSCERMLQLKFMPAGAITLDCSMTAPMSGFLSQGALQGKLTKPVYSDNTGSHFVSSGLICNSYYFLWPGLQEVLANVPRHQNQPVQGKVVISVNGPVLQCYLQRLLFCDKTFFNYFSSAAK